VLKPSVKEKNLNLFLKQLEKTSEYAETPKRVHSKATELARSIFWN
jgi:hypothetical protein